MWLIRQIFPIKIVLTSHKKTTPYCEVFLIICWPILINYHLLMGFPDSSVGKDSACNARDPGLIPGWERSALRRARLPTPALLGTPCAQLVENLPAMRETWV